MAITRNFIFAIEPYKNQGDLGPGVCSSISFATIPDGNDGEKSITCGFVPASKGTTIAVSQETLFIGGNAEAGVMYQTLKSDLAQDGTSTITAEFITARLDPDNQSGSRGRESTTKRYEWLDFNGPSLLEQGCEVFWTKDCNPVRDSLVTWKEFTYSTGDTGLRFESGLANWVHFKGLCTGIGSGEIMLSAFTLRYQYVGKGIEGRES